MKIENLEDVYGPQFSGDNNFTRKARLLQSYYRIEINENQCGIGPNRNSKRDAIPSFYGNMLVNGEETGRNFLLPETFRYALERIHNKKKNETIDEYRLFNNLLSSMPMAFNLFQPLMLIKEKNLDALNSIIKTAFSNISVETVTDIKIEFIPDNPKNYTNDLSAMDAVIEAVDSEGDKSLFAIEVKYTDSLGKNKAVDNDTKYNVAKELGLFTDEGLEFVKLGCSQIYRNFLLAEKYRQVHNFKNSYSVILAPKEHPSTQNEIDPILKFLKPEFRYKIINLHLEDFVDAIESNCPEEYINWIKRFRERYLNFSKIEHLL